MRERAHFPWCQLHRPAHALIFLFSPIFTILAKSYQPQLVGLDPSGMLFLLVSLAFAVTGSLLIGILLDRLRLSRFIFGKRQMIG